MEERHQPVLPAETGRFLAPERGGLFVDCTLGLGGHAEALLAASPEVRLIGVDRDREALERASRRLTADADRCRLVEGDFAELGAILERLGVERVDGLLADFGVSSLQLDRADRGFSFRHDGPLDMRMGGAGPSAADVVGTYSESELEEIFREYGEERMARRVARAVVTARAEEPLETTGRLADVVRRAKGPAGRRREGRIDPATRVFQALRIEVNRELEAIERLLDQVADLLEDDGRLVMISYHSLEDRRVKHALRSLARGRVDPITGRTLSETRVIELLTKKPVRPRPEEVAANPRSRSARLRAARRLRRPASGGEDGGAGH